MKSSLVFLCSCLVAGCAHRQQGARVVVRPVNEVTAQVIAGDAVRKAEKWGKVDTCAREGADGWKVYVVPIPCRGNTPYVWVTVNRDGAVTDYSRGKTIM